MQIMGMMYVMSKMTKFVTLPDPVGIRPTLQPFFENSLFSEYLDKPDLVDLVAEYANSITNPTYVMNYMNYTTMIARLASSFSTTELQRLDSELQVKMQAAAVQGSPTIAALIPQSIQQGRRMPGVATQQKIADAVKLKLKNENEVIKYIISKQIELIKSLKV
jgi:hypothetical protein